jgi:hypothetical protein
MKKLSVITIAVLLGAGFAFASSLSVPWFVDQPTTGAGWPATFAKTTECLIFLHNNQTGVMTATIDYYSQDGILLPQIPPATNTFTINPLCTVAFRPVASDNVDGSSNPNGQENALTGGMIPNRPMRSDIDPVGGAKKNGSLVITWVGKPTDLQGILGQSSCLDNPGPSARITQWGTLLPPGAD